MAAFKWSLPDSPDSKQYREINALLKAERERDPIRAMAWFAAICESDFWYWQKHVMPLGTLKIGDPDHRNKGKLVVDEPWFFDRMREVQNDFDGGATDVLYMWFRGSYKTTTIIKGGALWFLARDPNETVAIFTHKVEQTGENMGNWFVDQLKNNETLLDHWPQFRKPKKNSDTLIIVDRPGGAHEPSISIHPILGSAAGGHFTKILVDDAVTDKIAYSAEECKKVDDKLSYIQPLRRDNTQYFYVATPYTEQDPVWKRAAKGAGPERFFKRISKHPAILPGNVPQLFSLKYFKKTMRNMETSIAQSQYMLRMLPRGQAYFKESWLRRWRGTPEEAAKGTKIHIIVDMAEGKTDSDFSTVKVFGLTHDKKRRCIDCWREKIGLTGMADLLFGPVKGEESWPENQWIMSHVGARGLVGKWLKVDPALTLYVEEIGATGYAETFRREMRHRRRDDSGAPSCLVKELRSNRKKENRIAKLQPEYRNGGFEYPEGSLETNWQPGFGHGSLTTGDDRDVLEQFIDDEYKGWTLLGETLNDDLLDLDAWLVQPEQFFPFADSAPEDLMYTTRVVESQYAGQQSVGRGTWRTW